ncbi:MAG: thiopurine S-methyltransferase [Symploca sp. SIO1A3]|nr:thiopurine S-methyltransferase [Symploca sp. SIO1A3]
MDASFWLQKWKKNDIGFHKSEANPVLVKYFPELSLEKGTRVFLPLCGKTLDIPWLLSHGYRVAGAELSEIAIEQLFIELGVEPKISGAGNVKHYSAKNIDIFVGDIFDLSGNMLGPVDAIYDRAALVALPEEMRNRYTAHLTEITDKAPQLLVSYEYDQKLIEGPPFSVSNEEVNQHYRDNYDLTLIVSTNIPGGLKGKYAAKENVWLLQNDSAGRIG